MFRSCRSRSRRPACRHTARPVLEVLGRRKIGVSDPPIAQVSRCITGLHRGGQVRLDTSTQVRVLRTIDLLEQVMQTQIAPFSFPGIVCQAADGEQQVVEDRTLSNAEETRRRLVHELDHFFARVERLV